MLDRRGSGFGLQPEEPGTMNRPPRRARPFPLPWQPSWQSHVRRPRPQTRSSPAYCSPVWTPHGRTEALEEYTVGLEEYANLRLKAVAGDRGTIYAAVNLVARIRILRQRRACRREPDRGRQLRGHD
ncbi:MAG: hypothetical protein MZU95_07820 [Desulfomicrobium escambiense]|nr:hypothetical protein [Desulfomicrobium escambiense]